MSDLQAAAQQALEALEYHVEQTRPIHRTSETITALRAALAEDARDWSLLEATQESLREHMAEIQRLRATLGGNGGLGAWVDISTGDGPECVVRYVPAASGEPVAWTYTGIKADGSEHGPHLVWNPAYMDAMSASKGAQATPLYAARQPAPEPLTDEQVDRITTEQWGRGLGAPYAAYRAYARAIEQAHGIGAPDAQKGAQP
jgi:hypothetical protein